MDDPNQSDNESEHGYRKYARSQVNFNENRKYFDQKEGYRSIKHKEWEAETKIGQEKN